LIDLMKNKMVGSPMFQQNRKFHLWMPMVHDFEKEEDDFTEQSELLPVDELLDRVMIRRVRIAAVERGMISLLFIFLFCSCFVLQRSLADAYQLESALKVWLAR